MKGVPQAVAMPLLKYGYLFLAGGLLGRPTACKANNIQNMVHVVFDFDKFFYFIQVLNTKTVWAGALFSNSKC